MNKLLIAISSVLFMMACNSNDNTADSNADSTNQKKEAKDSNDAKFDTTNMKKDADFVVDAADGGMLEVQLGKLALKNASNADVKSMGQKMIDDHSKANDELKALAKKYNITIPDSLGEKSRDKYNDLSKLKGNDFDKKYTSMMVSDHKDDIDEFQKEADKGGNAELKNWASQTLPVLQGHLKMWEDIKDKNKY